MASLKDFSFGPKFNYLVQEASHLIYIFGTPEEIVRFYEAFIYADQGRYIGDISIKSDISNQDLEKLINETDEENLDIQSYLYASLIVFLRRYGSGKSDKNFDMQLSERMNDSRIDYWNYSYINFFSRKEDVLPTTIHKKLRKGQVVMRISNLKLNQNSEFKCMYWTVRQLTRYANIKGHVEKDA